jgi:hypothetical protein
MLQKLFGKLAIAAGLSLPLVALTAPSVFAQMVKVSVVNNSGKTMTAVYMSPPDKNTWGENELDASIRVTSPANTAVPALMRYSSNNQQAIF